MYAILQINKGAFFKQKDKLFRGDKKVISEFYIMKSYSFCRLFPSRFFVFLYFSAKSGKKNCIFSKKAKKQGGCSEILEKTGHFRGKSGQSCKYFKNFCESSLLYYKNMIKYYE